jgi:acyl-CoA synthetase (AMP-forming)/AMP-acid ligase II
MTASAPVGSGIPSTGQPRVNVAATFAERALAHPSRLALVDANHRLTYAQVDRAAASVASEFADRGLRAGDHIGVQLQSDHSFVVAYLALLSLGCVVIPLDPRLSVLDRARRAAVASARGLVVADASVTDDTNAEAPPVVATASAILEVTSHSYEELSPPPIPLGVRATNTRNAVTFFTSGTSGEPKHVRHSHRGIILAADHVNELERTYFSGPVRERLVRLAVSGWRQRRQLRALLGQQVWTTSLGYHTIGGHAVMMGALLGGRRLVCMATAHPRLMLDTVHREAVTTLAVTPAVAELLVRAQANSTRRYPSLAVVGLGSSPASQSLVRAIRGAFGCEVVVGYGSTELGGGVLATRIEDPRSLQESTVGRPFPSCDVRIVDASGCELPSETVGELVCRSDSLMTPHEDEQIEYRGTERWYRTGDLALMTADGYVRILGRLDDVVNRGGVKIVPREIEDVVAEHPAVECAAAVGVSVDRAIGNQLWVFVETTDGDLSEDLRARCLDALGTLKCPDRFISVRLLPRTDAGEVHRATLRQHAADLITTNKDGGSP